VLENLLTGGGRGRTGDTIIYIFINQVALLASFCLEVAVIL